MFGLLFEFGFMFALFGLFGLCLFEVFELCLFEL